MMAYTVMTDFGESLQGIFYSKDEAYHFMLYAIRSHFGLQDADDTTVLERNSDKGFAAVRLIQDTY